jgi:peptidoglycan hydrolase-like amidase
MDASILEPGRTLLVSHESVPLRCTGPDGAPVNFALEVPGVLRRSYFGTLAIEWQSGVLVAVLSMGRETAVNSITGAELPIARAGNHALMAQAVVARSFLTATLAPRHSEAFFCDTTHCQFLRSPAPPSSAVARAVAETKGVVLFSRDAVLTAYYSAACGGFTEGGLRDGHLYQRVSCETCRRFSLSRRGHGWGLCQEGAIDLSRRGYSWPDILTTYFPDASLSSA